MEPSTLRPFGSFVLGGNVFAWTVTKDDAFRILDEFVERGGRAIDTADLYPAWAPGCRGGESEEIIGAWLSARKGMRERVSIATKVAKWQAQPGLSSNNIRAAIDASLRRLATDHVDLYYAHEDDAAVRQEEYLGAFDALVRAGKARALGASNFTPERLTSALRLARDGGLRSFEVSQDHWNLVERGVEHDLIPLLEREHLVELPYWSLASGFLSGKYRPGKKVTSARSGAGDKYLANPKNVELLEKLDAIAKKHGASVSAVSLAWLRAQKCVGAPIASARTLEQLKELFDAVTLDDEDLRSLAS